MTPRNTPLISKESARKILKDPRLRRPWWVTGDVSVRQKSERGTAECFFCQQPIKPGQHYCELKGTKAHYDCTPGHGAAAREERS